MKNSQDFLLFSGKSDTEYLPRTDLACESDNTPVSGKGCIIKEYELNSIPVSELIITDSVGERIYKRRIGRYVTVHCPMDSSLPPDRRDALTDALSILITSFIMNATGKPVTKDTKILIAGLGNRFLSSDSIGPKTCDKVAVTAHMSDSAHAPLFELLGCARIFAVHPGVLGQTGIEAALIIKGAAESARPDAIIAIDALAARSSARLCATVQLSDAGIEPGSGIGNRRRAVDKSTVGYPVIAIGVPTVVDCATLIFDALRNAGVCTIDDDIQKTLRENNEMLVSPKDSDILSEEISDILSAAINRALLCEGF
ncbi:MAG: GPR endopeptidase [Clostridia bacterium]|nr:GPR endopeptidase [Clostridia bacterium]